MGHTPGPWFVREPDNDAHTEVYAEATGVVFFPEPADARLISAAPDLLAALCEARDAFAAMAWEGEENWRHWDATEVDQLVSFTLQLVNEAISKAQGRE